MGDSSAGRVLVFQVGDLTCGVPAAVAREILPPPMITRIPGAPEPVAGLTNLRGTLLTVVDGHQLLGREVDPGHEGALIVLDAAGRTCALSVGRVVDLVSVSAEAMERRTLPGVDSRIAHAVGRTADHHFVMLETDVLLGPILAAPVAGTGSGSSPTYQSEPRGRGL